MTEQNQYQAPSSNVEQSNSAMEYGDVKLLAYSGRIGRIRYIAYNFGITLVLFFVVMIGAFIGQIGMSADAEVGMGMGVLGIIMMLLSIAAYLFFFVITIMLAIQRSHDFNASGWLSLITFIPVASLIFLFIPGTNGENQYGLKTPPNGAATGVVIGMFILVPIMGIVAAIAIPAYQGYMQEVQRMQLQQTK